MKNNIAVILTMLLIVTGCKDSRTGWVLEGDLSNVSDSTLYIEEPSGMTWIIVDSVRTDKSGKFSYQAKYPVISEQKIYRLRMGDKAVYFPVVSANDNLKLEADVSDFGSKHVLTGTRAAEGFSEVDGLFAEAVERVGSQAIDDEALINSLATVILTDSTCIVGYYTVKHPVEGKPYFNTSDHRKLGLIGAVATRYKNLRPQDNRGKELEAIYTNAKKKSLSPKETVINAHSTGRPSVNLTKKDARGVERNLDEILDRGGVTLVNFTMYEHNLSPANTVALNQVYEKYKKSGLEIVQLGFDLNEALWRQNASKMPWITIYCAPSEASNVLVPFNVNPDGGPTTFIFDRTGELIERVVSPSELEKAVAKIMK